MSDMFDHEMDAWDQEIQFGEYLDGPEEYFPAGRFKKRRKFLNTTNYAPCPADRQYWNEEDEQPKFQQLVVTQIHAQTERSYCVSGTVHFDTPYRGHNTFEFLADWIPKSQCVFTGNTALVPQWLVRSRFQKRRSVRATIDIKIPF